MEVVGPLRFLSVVFPVVRHDDDFSKNTRKRRDQPARRDRANEMTAPWAEQDGVERVIDVATEDFDVAGYQKERPGGKSSLRGG